MVLRIWPMSKRLLAAALLFALTATARADDPRFHPHDVRTVFVIAKNDDHDEVQYGIHLDESCAPVGGSPLYAYWRQFEQGPNVTEDLNLLDRTVYGIKGQWVVARSAEGSKVLMTIKAAPDRPVAILTTKRDGKCVADPIATINGAPARLDRVFVHIPGFMRVDWIEIRGTTNGKPVVERIKH
jgi:hypothetical protein